MPASGPPLVRAPRLTALQSASAFLPMSVKRAEHFNQLLSACAASLGDLQLHPQQAAQLKDQWVWKQRRHLVVSQAPLPAELAQLGRLRHLSLGHQGRGEQGWWFVPSVALLRGLSGLRELRLNALPADLGSLTQLTLLEARLWDYHVAEYQFNSILPPSGFALAPLAGLTGLRHLTLHFSSEPRWEGEWHAMYDPEGPQELAHLSALTALESLQLRVPLNIRELPPLPALRALGTLGGVEVGALRQAPQLTRLEARQLLGADAADVQPCPGLQHVAVGCLKGVAAVAPELQHLTYLDLPKGPVYPLGDLQQLTSLQLPGYIASQFYLNTDLEALLAGRCTRLVLTHFEFKAAPLALCAGVRELDLELCRGGEGCRSGACLEPADPDGDDGWSDGMDDDEWDYDTKAWFSRMEDSSVCDLTLRYHKAAEFDCGWLQFLARWVSLERLSLHGGRHAAYPEFALQEFAEECARLRSPLRRLELHVPLSNAHASILQRQWLCAVVEAANPRITCTAPLTDLGDL